MRRLAAAPAGGWPRISLAGPQAGGWSRTSLAGPQSVSRLAGQ